MSTASILPTSARRKRFLSIRRPAAWLAALASGPKAAPIPGLWLVTGFAVVHAVLWTLILVNLKTGQDVHMDVAEAFAWGQKFLLGYGKHPPLSGWVAGVWFRLFPVTDWASYALAMATVSCGLVICWLVALRVVDHRRAFFVVVLLALYPIFNFKGFKYNPDLLQLVTLPLMVLAYLDAFEQRSVRSGVWLGLAGALALMTKYWAVTMIGAIGLAALIHPERLKFLRSPAPWVAIGVLAIAMLPHLVWLKQVDFVPFTYAGDTYSLTDRAMINDLALGYVAHNLALLAAPVVLGAIALVWRPFRLAPFPALARGGNASVNVSQAIHVWIIQAVVAVGPPLGALLLHFYIKTDWGIPMFFLVPLALIAIPAVRVRKVALANLTVSWLVITLVVLAVSPRIVAYELSEKRTAGATYRARSELARELTQVWHLRFNSRWPVVAAYTDTGQPVTFYSPDHPAPLTPHEPWSSGLTSLEEAKRSGFIGICETGDWKLEKCEAWMKTHAANAERIVMTTRRFFLGHPGPATAWNIFIVPPAR
ncbi:glycosyltransferase family 39 protein [Bradyrhizobium sp. BWA-3-5]|uniref:glycosyltransferase family 39 protein n=1 Tax=Bradyrhizobium sp. BWA-3-5 TaxID=3080013 RepID=UPI00293E3FA2|nr:glycosyltransferase family 39 protein [Bradyrhizobium sp. BWA-3-5]WOH65935.1 glycosyltransferase family 39 protein [Bradyrhizobium sp. BWA-3-5]